MPISVETVLTAGVDYSHPVKGYTLTDVVRVDVSELSDDEVDDKGYLKPGVAFKKDGSLCSRLAGLVTAVIAGGAAGAHTVTGITTDDTLVAVHHYTDGGAYADLTSEFTISDADEIDNAGETDTSSDTLVVMYERSAEYVFGVVPEPIKVASGNTDAILDAATDIDVAVALNGHVYRDVAEDNLGRAYNANELSCFDAPRCKLVLSRT